MNIFKLVTECVSAIALFCIGLIACARPRIVREVARRSSTSPLGKLNPFKGFIESKAYLINVRIGGLLAVLISCLLILSVWQRFRP